MSRLSLCLIVRNAERDLERCVLSARDIVDEIVIVDTGSTDGTRAIARAYAHRFAEYIWHDDFAAARNFSLSFATGDWVLVLDADEELDISTRRIIRPALEAAHIAAYQLLVRSLTGTHTAPVAQYQFRLFRNLTSIRYANPIHEQIVDSLLPYMAQTGLHSAQLPAVVVHHGYQEGYNPQRSERNQRLLRKALSEHPDDPYYLYKLARELKSSSLEESRALQSRAAEVLLRFSDEALRENVYATEVLANEIQDRAQAVGDEEALELCERVMARLPAHPVLHYLRGVLLWRQGRFQPARKDLELGLSMEDSDSALCFYYDVLEIRWRSNAMLGELYFQEGYYNRAEACFAKVLELQPDDSSSLAFTLRIQALRGDAVGALKACVIWIQRTADVEASLLCAELLFALNKHDTARLWLNRVQADFQDRPDVLERADQLLQMVNEAAP